jgi:hypothetical protein
MVQGIRCTVVQATILFLGLFAALAGTALAQTGDGRGGLPLTVTVDSVLDTPDATIDGICDDGAGNCTLRAAIEETNASFGTNVIEFEIVGCPNDICVIDIATDGGNSLPDIQSPTIIDGSTQPGNGGVCIQDIPDRGAYRIVVNGDGAEVGMRLELGSSGSVIRGLNIRNFFNNLAIVRSDDNQIECNFIGTDESGMSAAANNAANGIVFLCEDTGNIVGGTQSGSGNLISGNSSDGVQFFAGQDCAPTAGNIPSNNSVLGNFIGTAKDGVTPMGNGSSGISFFGEPGADNNFVGVLQDGQTVRGNVIGANAFSGIYIDGDPGGSDGSDSIVILGNFIGTDRTGNVDLGHLYGGVDIIQGNDNIVGGETPGYGNTIAFNGEGVYLEQDAGTGNIISGNSIYGHVGLGIELIDATGELGVTPNDAGDPDTGANLLQNFPVLQSAELAGPQLSVIYQVDSASLPLRVEFFMADSDGSEGQVFIGAADYVAAGSATVDLTDVPLTPDPRVIATARDAAGNTSEFSVSIPVEEIQALFEDRFESP